MAEPPRAPHEAALAEELASGNVTRGRPGRRSHADIARHDIVDDGRAAMERTELQLGYGDWLGRRRQVVLAEQARDLAPRRRADALELQDIATGDRIPDAIGEDDMNVRV